MTDVEDTFVLAIDGGGSQCRFALSSGNAKHVLTEGPANATTDFEGTVACLLKGLNALADLTAIPLDKLVVFPAFVGVAGVTSPQIAEKLSAALPLQHACYADDRLSAMRGALGTKDGVVAHCGTGSFFAAQYDGQYRLAGGWGSILGDEASAQWIGRKALAAALHQTDGFVSMSPLVRSLMDRFETTDGIVAFAKSATPDVLGTLAPLVTSHAADADAVAQSIMQAGARYVADGIDQMGWTRGQIICLTGGIGPTYQPFLPQDMRDALAAPIGAPLDGAIALAKSHANRMAEIT